MAIEEWLPAHLNVVNTTLIVGDVKPKTTEWLASSESGAVPGPSVGVYGLPIRLPLRALLGK